MGQAVNKSHNFYVSGIFILKHNIIMTITLFNTELWVRRLIIVSRYYLVDNCGDLTILIYADFRKELVL